MDFFKIDKRLQKLDAAVLQQCSKPFAEIEKTTEYCQLKVLNAFIENGVSESHFAATTGYGYDDRGRDTLDRVVAQSLGAEDALLRYSFASGTHTIAVALFGVLRPGDRLLCVTGRPYDTLIGVLGCDEKTSGSLADFNIEYNEVALKPDGTPNHAAITEELKSGAYRVAYIQRSRGYSLRPSLQIAEIERLCQTIRAAAPGVIIMVDNCYGEFTNRQEPCCVGADLIMGSLIKNPGGGIAPSGGYIAGRKELIEQCAYRMTAPGVGREIGATLGHNRELFMGWFNAPHVTGEALKTAVFAAAFFESCGYTVTPTAAAGRYYSKHCAGKPQGPYCLLPGYAARRAGRFFCYAGAVGHAGLQRPGNYGGRRFYLRLLYRPFGRRPAARTLRRLDARGAELSQRPRRRAVGGAKHVRKRPAKGLLVAL